MTGTRWLTYATLQLNYQIGRLDPFGYHVFNMAVHLAASMALWGVMRELLVHRRSHWPSAIGSNAAGIAFTVTLLWAVHPITTQAVAYVIQRAESMWSLGFLSGFYLFLRAGRAADTTAKRNGILALSILCFWLGMACKEPIVVALAILPIADRVFHHNSTTRPFRHRRKYYGVLLMPVVIAAPLVILPGMLQKSQTSSVGLFVEAVNPIEYWRTQPEALLVYAGKILLPVRQCFDYLWPPQNHPAVLLVEWIALITLVLFCIRGIYRRQAWCLFPALFLLCVSTTSMVPMIDLVVEHRIYLASAWLIASLVIGAVVAIERVANPEPTQVSSRTIGFRWSAAVAVVVCGRRFDLPLPQAIRALPASEMALGRRRRESGLELSREHQLR